MSEPAAPFANAGTPGTAPSAAAGVATCSRARSAAEIWSTAVPSVRMSAGVRVATTTNGIELAVRIGLREGRARPMRPPPAAMRHRAATRPGRILEFIRGSCFTFAMKFSPRGARNRAARMKIPGKVFGLRICLPPGRMAAGRLFLAPRLHRAESPDWLCPRRLAARWGSVMRYRSATVADSDGLPSNPGRCDKEPRRCLRSRKGQTRASTIISINTDLLICCLPTPPECVAFVPASELIIQPATHGLPPPNPTPLPPCAGSSSRGSPSSTAPWAR